MRYYLIAGEASGDLHGSNLLAAIRQCDQAAEFRFWGGDKMAATAGVAPVKHIRELAFMGFIEVVRHLGEIMGNLRNAKRDVAQWQPDVVILIDYPGFNFRLLKFLKERQIPVIYYIAPQVWAWKEGRVATIKKYVDQLFVIFPFEQAFFSKHGIAAEFAGHPLLDVPDFAAPAAGERKSVIALLPGSRKKVVQYLLPEMLQVVDQFPDREFVVCGSGLLGEAFYQPLMAGSRARLVVDQTYDILRQAQGALVTSGTATLETALMEVPQVVCYKGNALSFWLAKKLVRNIRFICIVNLIADREVVTELLQEAVNGERMAHELRLVLGEKREAMLGDYREVRRALGAGGASQRAAGRMVQWLREKVGAQQ
ncbi:MAG: lipid-A-disaccharide synthase [Chitinophagales bacterium]